MRKFFSVIKNAVRETDKLLLFLCLAASAYGLLAVHSATLPDPNNLLSASRDTVIMLMAVTLGVIMCLIISFIDYEMIIRLWPFIAFFCIAIMGVTMKWGVAPPLRPDAKSWLVVGSYGDSPVNFQPSELVKIGFIITFGMHLELVKDKMNSLLNIALLCVHGMIPVALVIVTGDLGSALVFLIIFASMMYLGGLSAKNLAIGAVATAAATPLVWKFVLQNIQKERFLALLHPEEYPDVIFQQEKGLTAIGAGGIFGQGLFKGEYTQRGIVPESHNDMIFSVIGEELGFIGCLAAVLLLFFIVIKIIKVGRQSKDNATSLMCYGVAAMIAGQVIVNIGMCLMLLPVVGITLPFFSAGGSSNLCLYIGIGLVLSIHRFSQEREAVNFRLRRVRTPFSDD